MKPAKSVSVNFIRYKESVNVHQDCLKSLYVVVPGFTLPHPLSIVIEVGFFYVTWAGLEFLGSRHSPASASS